MDITCPACNKASQSDAVCRRCGCDLQLLHRVVASAQSHLHAALTALQDLDWTRACSHAEHSWQLVHSPEAARLAFLATSAAGETATALRWRKRAHTSANA